MLLWEQQLQLNKMNEWNVWASRETDTDTDIDTDRVMEQAINNSTIIKKLQLAGDFKFTESNRKLSDNEKGLHIEKIINICFWEYDTDEDNLKI